MIHCLLIHVISSACKVLNLLATCGVLIQSSAQMAPLLHSFPLTPRRETVVIYCITTRRQALCRGGGLTHITTLWSRYYVILTEAHRSQVTANVTEL